MSSSVFRCIIISSFFNKIGVGVVNEECSRPWPWPLVLLISGRARYGCCHGDVDAWTGETGCSSIIALNYS